MQMVWIEAVKEPKSFDGKPFTKAEWQDAVKAGKKKVPVITAMEAIKNSKGLYVVKADAAEVEKKIAELPDPDDMSSQALVAEMTAHGKPPRKKMNRSTAVQFVRQLRIEAAELIIDEDE